MGTIISSLEIDKLDWSTIQNVQKEIYECKHYVCTYFCFYPIEMKIEINGTCHKEFINELTNIIKKYPQFKFDTYTNVQKPYQNAKLLISNSKFYKFNSLGTNNLVGQISESEYNFYSAITDLNYDMDY